MKDAVGRFPIAVSTRPNHGCLRRHRRSRPTDATHRCQRDSTQVIVVDRLRFFAVHPELSAGEVEHFTHVDHRDREALVALDGPDIAVGRFDRSPGTDHAEVAFVVADEWQGRGVGTCLLRQLTVRARAAGIAGFVADMLEENYRMRDLIRHSGLMGTSTAEWRGSRRYGPRRMTARPVEGC